jgi:hypothetical protein
MLNIERSFFAFLQAYQPPSQQHRHYQLRHSDFGLASFGYFVIRHCFPFYKHSFPSREGAPACFAFPF